MVFKHQFTGIRSSRALERITEARIEKLSRFLPKEGHCSLFYSKGKHKTRQIRAVISNPDGRFTATSTDASFRFCLDGICTKLERQMLRQKEKIQHHKNFFKSKRARLQRMNSRLEPLPPELAPPTRKSA